MTIANSTLSNGFLSGLSRKESSFDRGYVEKTIISLDEQLNITKKH